MLAVDRRIVVLSGALETLQSSFLDQHNYQRTQSTERTGRRTASPLSSDKTFFRRFRAEVPR